MVEGLPLRRNNIVRCASMVFRRRLLFIFNVNCFFGTFYGAKSALDAFALIDLKRAFPLAERRFFRTDMTAYRTADTLFPVYLDPQDLFVVGQRLDGVVRADIAALTAA